MGLELDQRGLTSQAIRQVVAGRIGDALAALRPGRKGSLDERVHLARKRLKEVRAALRLARHALGERTFARENRAVRDAARPLSELRDAQALIEALDALVADSPELTARAVELLRTALVAGRRSVHHRVVQTDKALEQVERALRAARLRVEKWPLGQEGFAALGPGLLRIYRNGRRARRRALASGETADLHEWRKRVKDLGYALELLAPLRPKRLGRLAAKAHELARILGDDHDLCVLLIRARAEKRLGQTLAESIEAKQEKLRREARQAGKKLYGQKPAAFVRRLRGDWDAFQSKLRPGSATVARSAEGA